MMVTSELGDRGATPIAAQISVISVPSGRGGNGDGDISTMDALLLGRTKVSVAMKNTFLSLTVH